jgi:5-methyltetrahydrofolate--homocysteine methyltransferase
MVSADKILEEAQKQKVDIIGLSGLITPSLDEMVHVASEMERLGLKIPLLIGGATTSKIHTAVKIAQAYSAPIVHVLDASKSVTVASSLLSDDNKASFVEDLNAEYAQLREDFANRKSNVDYISIEEARRNKLKIDWATENITTPKFIGTKVLNNYPLAEIAEYIDWSPFFSTWEMSGTFPRIFENERYGSEAKKLYDDAQKMLKAIIAENRLTANATFGIFESKAVNEQVQMANGKSFNFLRQQTKKQGTQTNTCLADFISPGKDYIGAFAVTTGIGIEKWIAKYEADHDDYSAILVKALADRLAEAFTELLHKKVRTDYWGYAENENLSIEDMIQEKYVGIRPAPGYAACPDHFEKKTIWELLDVENKTGIKLTESHAMYPTAAVSGFYFASPHIKYFGVGKIQKDQIEQLASARGLNIQEVEKWLRPNLAY